MNNFGFHMMKMIEQWLSGLLKRLQDGRCRRVVVLGERLSWQHEHFLGRGSFQYFFEFFLFAFGHDTVCLRYRAVGGLLRVWKATAASTGV